MARIVDEFPRWYTPLKWLMPISAGMFSGMVVGLAIMGILPIPFSFGKIAWLPAIYNSLELAPAMAMLGGAMAAVSSIVGLMTSFVLRATVLFQTNEHIASQAQTAQKQVDRLEELVEFMDAERQNELEHNHRPEVNTGPAILSPASAEQAGSDVYVGSDYSSNDEDLDEDNSLDAQAAPAPRRVPSRKSKKRVR